MKILVLLPCNSGAKYGNYFLGRYWKNADRYRKQYNLENVMFGAIDCIPVFTRGEDAIVLETEMDCVRGFDIYPEYRREKVDRIARGIVKGLLRVHKSFSRIIILLNVKLYIEATKRALELIPQNIRQKMEFHYVLGKPGKFLRLIKNVFLKLAKLKKD